MNDETLKYYIALQPLFREKMGDWHCGDAYVDEKFPTVIQYITPHHLQQELSMGSNIRIPKTIDDSNSKRGLTGMLIGYFDLSSGWFCRTLTDKVTVYRADTPTLVILKALAAQEGVQI